MPPVSETPGFSWTGYRPIWLLTGVVLLADIGIGLAVPLWAVRVRDLGGTTAFLGLVVGAVGLARLLTATTAGVVSDRLGRRQILLTALACLTLAALGTAVTPWAVSLLALRLLEGIGWEAMNVAGVAYVADRLRDDPYRGRVMAAYQAARRGSRSLSPVIGGFLATWFGAAPAFLVYAALATLAAVLAFVAVPPARAGAERRGGLGAVVEMARTPSFLALGLVGLILVGADLGIQQLLVPTIGHEQGLSQSRIGLVLGAYGLLLTLVSLVGGWIVDRFGARTAITLGMLVTAVGYAFLPLAVGFIALAGAMAVAGLGRGLAGSGPNVFILDLFPDRQGAGQGAYRSINGFGRTIIPPLMAAAAISNRDLAVWLVAGALAVATINLWRLVGRRRNFL